MCIDCEVIGWDGFIMYSIVAVLNAALYALVGKSLPTPGSHEGYIVKRLVWICFSDFVRRFGLTMGVLLLFQAEPPERRGMTCWVYCLSAIRGCISGLESQESVTLNCELLRMSVAPAFGLSSQFGMRSMALCPLLANVFG
jgi:hypothetical protein